MFRRWAARNVVWAMSALAFGGMDDASAQDGDRPGAAFLCEAGAVSARRAEFRRLLALKRFQPWAVSDDALRAASADYVASAEQCYGALAGPSATIDDGPLMPWEPSGIAPFTTMGAKWGAGAFTGGMDAAGPGLPGGTVTYSFMATGVSMGGHSDANQSITSLPGFQACFASEIREAFTAWAAVANIQFVEVADNGVPFDGAGARGDIRIGAHAFDGPWGVLAHAYYPPPGGVSAAGDIHFDRHETYSCNAAPGTVDIGIVAMHEIGHAIGLAHEARAGRTAMMNPTYNPVTASLLLADDVDGAVSIYGRGVSRSDSLVVSFGQNLGLWDLDFGRGWLKVHQAAPRLVVSGDLDGNGIDEVVAAFDSIGVWIQWNNSSWGQLNAVSPSLMAVGDLDGNRVDDLVVDFPGAGLFVLYNGWSWSHISSFDASVLAVGNIDGAAADDVVVTFPGRGVWTFRNGSSWSVLHPADASLIAIGALDAPTGPADMLLAFPGHGLFRCLNLTSWSLLHGLSPTRVAVGNLDGDPRGDAVIDFGPAHGVWTLNNQTTWAPLHGFPSKAITLGDFDGNGQSDVVLDFGPAHGFWIHVNGSSWLQGHPFSPTALEVATLK